MEQDVDNGFRNVCSTCLSGDRNLVLVNGFSQVYQIFRLIMYDFAGDRLGDSLSDLQQHICWECEALMQRFARFKRQAHNAQEHLRVIAMSRSQEGIDISHTYMSQSLSCLDSQTKCSYDKIYVDYTNQDPWTEHQYVLRTNSDSVKDEGYDMAQGIQDNIHLDPLDTQMIEVPEIVLQNPVTGNMSHILIRQDLGDPDNLIMGDQDDQYATVSSEEVKLALMKEGNEYKTIEIGISAIDNSTKVETIIMCQPAPTADGQTAGGPKSGYTSEQMTEAELTASREKAKARPQYASAVYKCELCVIGFYTQQQVEDHFLALHRNKPGLAACRVCYVFIEARKLEAHVLQHYLRYRCKLCDHVEYSCKLMTTHVRGHMTQSTPNSVIKIGDNPVRSTKGRRKREQAIDSSRPGNLRKLLSKKIIEGYQCLECDMFFKNSRARKNHVQRCHREGLQCDHCKKFFVNRTTLATHLKLHEGPLPRSECPICRKMVRVIQLKYHIQRHQTKGRYECEECDKVFSHLATYHAHLKYSRAHASDDIFKFPCPMCNKGYPTKEAMQDHFNYQHLGKTSHKCPICDKPIATRVNVEKHLMRVHGQKKDKPRNHVCQQCGKAFTDKKALQQHEVIHSGARPLVCEVCQHTFKQKASLYTHKKRVHKIFPSKKVVEFMESKP